MIKVNNLSFNYGKEEALKDINLNIVKNSTCAIIGPSGCGKTTLLYILAGLLSDFQGTVKIDETNLTGIRKQTGLILQNGGLLPWKSMWDNIALGLKIRGIDKNKIEEKASSILKELNIFEHKDKFPSQLSGGQKQRAAIGRTLSLDPDLLLLDEASSALDAINREKLQDLILNMYKKRKMTLVMVTHSIEEAVFLGQKIVVIDKGSIRHIIENPYFGDENIRFSSEYYDICLQVRKWLNEGDKS
jgi:NitT/TauT family transport system ATP-binding protein